MVFKESQIGRKREREPIEDTFELEEEFELKEEELEMVRGNPLLWRIKEEKAKDLGINTKLYSREIKNGEIEKLVNDVCEENKNLERKCLLNVIGDIQTKLSIYRASFDLYLDKVAKLILFNQKLKGSPAFLEGIGFCEIKKENGKIKLKRIKETLPDYYIISHPLFLEKEILPVVAQVTGVSLEKLKEDLKKIGKLSPKDLLETVYGTREKEKVVSVIPQQKVILPLNFKSSLSDIYLTPLDVIHEITHLESRLEIEDYREGEATLAEIQGGKKLAQRWKDIYLKRMSHLKALLMPATYLAQYLCENGESGEKVIDFLHKVCPQEEVLRNIFGENWTQGKINEEAFEKKRKYFARAYEIAKFFGENVKVLTISFKDWKKLWEKRKNYKELFRHQLKKEFLDYSFSHFGGEASLDLSHYRLSDFLDFFQNLLREKIEILKAEKKYLEKISLYKKWHKEKILEFLEKRGLTPQKRLELIEREISETENKLNEIKKNKTIKNISFKDLFWEI